MPPPTPGNITIFEKRMAARGSTIEVYMVVATPPPTSGNININIFEQVMAACVSTISPIPRGLFDTPIPRGGGLSNIHILDLNKFAENEVTVKISCI